MRIFMPPSLQDATVLVLVLAVSALPILASPAHADAIPPPIQQARDGVPLDEIVCSDNRSLMQSPSGSPACVFAKSIGALEQRGFVLISEAGTTNLPVSASSSETEKTSMSIKAGWRSGECIGHCAADMTLTPEKVVYHTNTGMCMNSYVEVREEVPFQEQEWDRLVGLLDLENFYALPDYIETRGPTDRQLAHVEISDNGTSKRVLFERHWNVVPWELSENEEFVKTLLDMLDDLDSKYKSC